MGSQYQRKCREKRLVNFLQKRLENMNIFADSDWIYSPDAEAKIKALAAGSRDYAADSVEMGITGPEDREQAIFATYFDSAEQLKKIIREKAIQFAEGGFVNNIHVCFITCNMKERIMAESHFDDGEVQRDLRNAIKKGAGDRPSPRLEYTYIVLHDSAEKAIRLNGISRHEVLLEPPMDGNISIEHPAAVPNQVQAMVCTTGLYQLVQVYHEVGDQLFHRNVRFGIGENMGVGQAICRTLSTEPEHFFFKNSGITILAKNPQVHSLEPERLTLGEIREGSSPDFSVVNGAQTISVAAEYFFRLEAQKELGKWDEEQLRLYERAKEKARVMVRIIRIAEDPQNGIPSLASQISVALNRQKPISMEDIAFTHPVVQKLERYLQSSLGREPGAFQLVRRGEETEAGKEMLLQDFIRAREACAGKPGIARSGGTGVLLKFQDPVEDARSFRNTTIFPKDWIEAEMEEEKAAAFRRHYRAVWFIYELSEDYHSYRKKLNNKDSAVQIAMQNGKWYFAAAVTQVLNRFRKAANGEEPDYAEFDYQSINLMEIRKNLSRTILLFSQLTAAVAREIGVEIDANTFKKDSLYRAVMEKFGGSMEGQNDFSPKAMARELESLLWQGQQGVKSPGQETENTKFAGEDYVVLGGEMCPAASKAEAQVLIVKYVFSHTQLPPEAFLGQCQGWLTDDGAIGSQKENYFRTAHQIQAEGKAYWVGTQSNMAAKIRQVNKLCSIAGVDKKAVEWYGWDKSSKTHRRIF